jgi:aminoglycoside/choline kinase family phosphotransferase
MLHQSRVADIWTGHQTWCSVELTMKKRAAAELLGNLRDWSRVEPLTGDASQRRYSRIWAFTGATAILVEYPRVVRDQLARDLDVLSWCRDRGLPVPSLLASDLSGGRAMLEDFGDTDAEVVISETSPADRGRWFGVLLGPLVTLASCEPARLPCWNPPLDETRLRWELAGFELWYVGHHKGTAPGRRLSRWLDALAASVALHPRRVCHRDYHLNNLLIRPGRRIGVIDIQDILVGPDTYDIVSLVAERAAIRLLSADDRSSVMTAWAEQTAARPGWRERALRVRLQRGLKVLGSFARFVAEGRAEYLGWLEELAPALADPASAVGAPPEAIALLVD